MSDSCFIEVDADRSADEHKVSPYLYHYHGLSVCDSQLVCFVLRVKVNCGNGFWTWTRAPWVPLCSADADGST